MGLNGRLPEHSCSIKVGVPCVVYVLSRVEEHELISAFVVVSLGATSPKVGK